MKLEQSFEVAAPLDRVWAALIDVERVAPCLPGAAVTGRNEDGSYDGTFKVKIGPTSAAYTGKLQMEHVDADAHTATMQAAGTDKRGQGGAKATIVSSVSAADANATKVDVATDYHITGRLARFGRGGMIEEISNRLLREFASSLQAMLAADPGQATVGAGAAEAAEGAAVEGAAAAGDGAQPVDVGAEPVDAGAERVDVGAPEEPEAIGTAQVLGSGEPPAEVLDGGAPGPEQARADDHAPAAGLPVPGPSRQAPPENEPVQGLSLVASALWSQAKRNPLPLLTALLGFLMALRVFRRRS